MAGRRLVCLQRHLRAPVAARPPRQPATGSVRWRRPLHRAACAAHAQAHMQAVVLPSPGPVEALEYRTDVPKPDPSGAQVRIKVAACAVCHRDLLDRQGAFPFMQQPTILGHEIAGVVDAVGPEATQLKPGQRVVSLHWAPCRECEACRDGRTTDCAAAQDFLALTCNGGYAEYLVANEGAFVPVPAGWDPLDASAVMCTFGTVFHAAVTRGRLREGERVLVTGASGGVGHAAVILFKAMGCNVTAVTSNPDKVASLKELGADHVVVAPDGRFDKDPAVRGQMDMAFEAVGGPTFQASLRSLRRAGRLVLVGNVSVSKEPLALGLMIINGLEIIGADGCTADELSRLFAFMDEHKIRPRISKVLDLPRAAEAHTILAERGAVGRVVLEVQRNAW